MCVCVCWLWQCRWTTRVSAWNGACLCCRPVVEVVLMLDVQADGARCVLCLPCLLLSLPSAPQLHAPQSLPPHPLNPRTLNQQSTGMWWMVVVVWLAQLLLTVRSDWRAVSWRRVDVRARRRLARRCAPPPHPPTSLPPTLLSLTHSLTAVGGAMRTGGQGTPRTCD